MLDWTPAYRLCNTRQSIAQQPQEQKPSILDLLQDFPAARCRDRHDKIYSLLALAKEGNNIKVDYSHSTAKLIHNVLVACGLRICLYYLSIITNVLHMGSVPQSYQGLPPGSYAVGPCIELDTKL